MNQDKFERHILRKTKTLETYEWDLLDETGSILVEHIMDNEDEGHRRSGVLVDGIVIHPGWK